MKNLRRSPWLPLAIASAASVLAACTLIVGHITIPMCSDEQCDTLNVREGIPATSCPRWFCSHSDGACHKGPVDADGDNFIDLSCPDGDDCDDSVASAHPGGTESCNGADDDCNGIIDDGKIVGATGNLGSAGMGPNSGEYSHGTAGQSLATWATPTNAQSMTLQGEHAAMARPIFPVTNSRGASVGDVNDSLIALVRHGMTPPTMASCMILMEPGATACTGNPDCLHDRGTCMAGGLCTGSAMDPSTTPFTSNGSCLQTHPDLPDGGMVPPTPDDRNCQRQDVCVRGECVKAIREDVGVSGCRLSDSAVDDVDGTSSILAAVDTQGCGHGALRLFAASADLTSVSSMGPEYRSNVYTGVDPTPTVNFDGGVRDLGSLDGSTTAAAIGRCTGFSRTDLRLGAARPSIAGLHGMGVAGPPQALVAFQARSAIALQRSVPAACAGMDTSPVSILGAFVESTGGEGIDIHSVIASNDGIPQDLGTTSGVLPIGVASLAGAHYVAVYPDATMSDQIAVWVLDPAPAPPMYAGGGDAGTVNPFALRTTSPLTIPAAPVAHIPVGVHPDGAVVAAGGASAGGTKLGVAWQEGCDGAAGTSVHFAVVDWHATGVSAVSPPITVSTGLGVAYHPAILYVPHGFLRVGSMKGTTTVTTANDGGWLIGFIGMGMGGQRFFAMRVSELDGSVLEAPVDTLPAGSSGTAVQSGGLYAFGGTARAGYAALDTAMTQITGGQLLCLPTTAPLPDGGTP